jgi:hypothetical protein
LEEREKDKKRLLEDTLESFLGCTEYAIDNFVSKTADGRTRNNYGGVGYNIVYIILKTIFDPIDISLVYEDIVDSITRLNELKQTIAREGKGKITSKEDVIFTNEGRVHKTVIVWTTQNETIVLAEEVAPLKKDSLEKASQAALDVLAQRFNIFKPPPPRWKQITSPLNLI